jgi:hypothetical protein
MAIPWRISDPYTRLCFNTLRHPIKCFLTCHLAWLRSSFGGRGQGEGDRARSSIASSPADWTERGRKRQRWKAATKEQRWLASTNGDEMSEQSERRAAAVFQRLNCDVSCARSRSRIGNLALHTDRGKSKVLQTQTLLPRLDRKRDTSSALPFFLSLLFPPSHAP